VQKSLPLWEEGQPYGVSPKAAQKEVERFAAKRYGRWGRLAYLAYKFERVFRKRNYVDIVEGERR
jgi:hypothetical protein